MEESNVRRFDDLVRSERYFTATLLPLLLFHNNLEGVRHFIDLVEKKAITERNRDGDRGQKVGTKYDFQEVEVITEFHIARDLDFAGLPLDVPVWRGGEGASAEPSREAPDIGPSEEDEPKKDDPDVVIVAGPELVVCEGKFFNGVNTTDLNEQLRSQRCQVRHLFLNRPSLRAYRHVAILPSLPATAIDADVVLTWKDILGLAELIGCHPYVTDRLRCAVERYPDGDGEGILNWDGKLRFTEMRDKCREPGNDIQVGHEGGEAALLKATLGEAEKKYGNGDIRRRTRGALSQETGCLGHAGWKSSSPHVASEAEVRERCLPLGAFVRFGQRQLSEGLRASPNLPGSVAQRVGLALRAGQGLAAVRIPSPCPGRLCHSTLRSDHQSLMRLVPVLRRMRVHLERHVQLHRRLGRVRHHLLDERDRRLDLLVRRLEHELVVHLEQHPGAQTRAGKRCVHARHGAADDVGRRALDRRVDRRALVEGAFRNVR